MFPNSSAVVNVQILHLSWIPMLYNLGYDELVVKVIFLILNPRRPCFHARPVFLSLFYSASETWSAISLLPSAAHTLTSRQSHRLSAHLTIRATYGYAYAAAVSLAPRLRAVGNPARNSNRQKKNWKRKLLKKYFDRLINMRLINNNSN